MRNAKIIFYKFSWILFYIIIVNVF
jgi:hypothetical protein